MNQTVLKALSSRCQYIREFAKAIMGRKNCFADLERPGLMPPSQKALLEELEKNWKVDDYA